MAVEGDPRRARSTTCSPCRSGRVDRAVGDVEAVFSDRRRRRVRGIVRLVRRIVPVHGGPGDAARAVRPTGAVPDLVRHRHLVGVGAGAHPVQLTAADVRDRRRRGQQAVVDDVAAVAVVVLDQRQPVGEGLPLGRAAARPGGGPVSGWNQFICPALENRPCDSSGIGGERPRRRRLRDWPASGPAG